MFYVLKDTNIGSTYIEQNVLQTIRVYKYKTSTYRVRMLGEDSAAITIMVALRLNTALFLQSLHYQG